MEKHLKLGTRKSLLAWAQSSWVARQVERLNPGCTVELVGIETRGDRILDVSLQSIEGKEFFVAELDEALKSGRVDMTVHSMKDLSLERPSEFTNAAIPPRENPRDAVLFGPHVLEKLSRGKKLRIGTSSPRRLENVPPFLKHALPRISGHTPDVELVEIRGNVNTRLSRVHEPEESDRHLDAVVLAFAGLIRLAADESGWKELSRLLEGVRWMVLPLRQCPAAPAQGALAVECRAEDASTRAILSKLHDPTTAASVASERELLARWGGGCHQRFGATRVDHPELGALLHIRGVKPDGTFVDELSWKKPAQAGPRKMPWNGNEWRKASESTTELVPNRPMIEPSAPVFVAHSRAWHPEIPTDRSGPVWTSGTSSWYRLAERGIWVSGCAENLGFDSLVPTLGEKVLALPSLSKWVVLTHQEATESWSSGKVIGTYRIRENPLPEKAIEELKSATHVYWSSGSQFYGYRHHTREDAHHACGPGKTIDRLRQAGINPAVFPSTEEWIKWLEI